MLLWNVFFHNKILNYLCSKDYEFAAYWGGGMLQCQRREEKWVSEKLWKSAFITKYHNDNLQ